MGTLFLAAQAMGILLFICEATANIQKTSRRIILFNAVGKVFEILQYTFLFALTGALFAVFKLGRYVLFYYFHKHGKKPSKRVFTLLALTLCAIGIAGWDGYLSLLVIAATLISLFATWQGVARNIRVAFMVANALLAVYAFAVMAYAGVVAYGVQITLLGVSFYRYDVKKAGQHKASY